MRGKNGHPISVRWNTVDIFPRDNIYTDAAIPRFLNENNVSGKRRRGRNIEERVNTSIRLHNVLGNKAKRRKIVCLGEREIRKIIR